MPPAAPTCSSSPWPQSPEWGASRRSTSRSCRMSESHRPSSSLSGVLCYRGRMTGEPRGMTTVSKPRTISRDDLIAGIAALPIGVVAGVTGVGGGEYRAPVLLALLRNVRWTIAGNLLAGAMIGLSTAILRGAFSQPLDTLVLAAVMVIASMPGAYCGALVARRTPSKWIKLLLAGILVATSLRLLVFESPVPGPFSFGP